MWGHFLNTQMKRRVMKFHLLSFTIACIFAFVVFIAYHSLRPENSGAAQASLGAAPGVSAGEERDFSHIRAIKAHIVQDADQLLELSGFEIEQILSVPELVRSDLPTVVWQYRTEACVLDVYFTASSDDVSKAPVAHYEFRSRDKKGALQVNSRDCLSGMVQGGNLISLLDVSAFYKSGS